MNYESQKARNRELSNREYQEGATRLESRPQYFWFDLNGPCNLECLHCGFRSFGRTSAQEVSQAVYDVILAELMPTAYACRLGGTNWGEMTIAKAFHPFVRDCLKYGVAIELTTNGTRISAEWIDDLADALSVIGFSMEGMYAEFEKIRGFKWAHFVRNVEKIVRARAARGRNFRVEWRFCAHADNVHQLPSMIREAQAMGVDRIQVMTLVPYLKTQKFKNLYFNRSTANQAFAEARRVAEELQFDIVIPPDLEPGSFEPQIVEIERPRVRPTIKREVVTMRACYYPWQTCSINELGEVRACGVHWRSQGSLEQSSFEAIWNGPGFRKLRSGINSNPDKICYACRRPQFDSEDGRSLSQLAPGVRDLLNDTLAVRRRTFQFVDDPTNPFRPKPIEAAEDPLAYPAPVH